LIFYIFEIYFKKFKCIDFIFFNRSGNTFETNSKSGRNFLFSFGKNDSDGLDFNKNNFNQLNSNINNVLQRANNRPQITSPSEVSAISHATSRPILGLPSGLWGSASSSSVVSHLKQQPINQSFPLDSFKTPCNKISKPLNESTLKTNDSNSNNNNREREAYFKK
jgi:hypothetical protein